MLATAGESKRLAGMLLARANVVIDLGAELERYLTVHRLATVLSTMLRRVARMPDRYAAAIMSDLPYDAPRSVAVVVGSAQNFAHHLWNYFPGLERIADEGLTGHVDEIRVAGTEFYGPIAHLFPEFADTAVAWDGPGGLRDPHPFSPDHLLVQPGAVFVRRSLRARVVNAMRQLPLQQGSGPDPDHSDVAAVPIVWIGLRVGSRSWVGQDEVLPRIIDRVHELWPDALTVLDGYSYPVGRDDISYQWSRRSPNLPISPRPSEVVSAAPTGSSAWSATLLRESVLWASKAHAYLTPLGTSQHKVGWFTDAPGVVYAPPSLETSTPIVAPGLGRAKVRRCRCTCSGLLGTEQSGVRSPTPAGISTTSRSTPTWWSSDCWRLSRRADSDRQGACDKVQPLSNASAFQGIRAVAQLGSALDWGSRGRRFKSCQPDRSNRL